MGGLITFISSRGIAASISQCKASEQYLHAFQSFQGLPHCIASALCNGSKFPCRFVQTCFDMSPCILQARSAVHCSTIGELCLQHESSSRAGFRGWPGGLLHGEEENATCL